MANKHKGEIEFEAAGQSYTLRFSANALCEVEAALGKTIVEITTVLAAGEVSMTIVRALLWCGLRQHHRHIDLMAAGDLIEAVGGLMAAYKLVGEAFASAFPSAEGGNANPPMEAVNQTNGIGHAS